MKKINTVFALLFSMSILFSCSDKDETLNFGDEVVAQEQNATEEREITVSELSKGIVIDNATSRCWS